LNDWFAGELLHLGIDGRKSIHGVPKIAISGFRWK